ncbi:uromodulin-like [Sciurus carolinensis]|uniref:uromodulin-like n=1 Tax=Sciurus carolinensis TaxID=30640 RepID=UPI001FB258E2|nr:uromodulin-like [Sciurus carolinensis]
MTATLPTSPLKSSLTGSNKETTSTHGTWKERLNTTFTTSTNAMTLSNSEMTSLLNDQEGTSRTTTLPIIVTSNENSKQNQTTPITAPQTTNTPANRMESSASPDSEKAATSIDPIALKTPGDDTDPSGFMTITVSEMSAPNTSSTLDKINDTSGLLSTTTSTAICTNSLNTTTLGTTVPGTTTTRTQEGQSTAAPPPPATIPMTSKTSDSHHNTATGTPSHPAQTASGVGTETRAVYSTVLVLSSSGTMKSSAMTEPSQTPPRSSQNSSPRAEACALDEYIAGPGDCRCNDSYHAHTELSRMPVTLNCWPQKIEVALSSCFLETQHWNLKKDGFSGCSSIKKIEQGHRVQVFMLEKKQGTCGLQLLTNDSHALYSLKVQLQQVLPGSNITEPTILSFSCAYPLAVNISQTLPHLVDSIPTIHFTSTGDTIIILSVFTDFQLSTPLKNRTAPLGTLLYVVLNATSSDPDRFALVVNEVFASTNTANKEAVKATYHFVNESCPVPSRLLHGLQSNGASLQVTIAFKLFRFLNSDTLYLHARVTLCDKLAERPCPPTCSLRNPAARNSPWESRTREDLERGGRWIVFGPLRITESKASRSRNSPGSWMAIFLLMVIDWILD